MLALVACRASPEAGKATPSPKPTTSSGTPAATSATTGPTMSPTPAVVDVTSLRVDSRYLLITSTQQGRATTVESLSSTGGRHHLGLPSATFGTQDFPVQAFTVGGRWFVMTSDCAYAGLRLYHSDNQGRVWSKGVAIGFVGCHAGDVAQLFPLGRGLMLVTSSGVGERTSVFRSTDGVHWPRKPQRRDDAASTLAFAADASYVRVRGFLESEPQTLLYSASLTATEHSSKLPGGARPLGYTLTHTTDAYLLFSTSGKPYLSTDGRTWSSRAAAFPGCRCSRIYLTAVSANAWWAQAREGSHSRYALTINGGRSWEQISGPPGPDPTYPNFLTAWNATSAVVTRDHDRPWLTTDQGARWRRI